VGSILGLNIDGDLVTDIIGNGLDIYYNPTLNPGLGGLTYNLTGGGFLKAATPLPASFWLLLAGLVRLGFLVRRRKEQIS
jgi:hypothetical protein